MGFAVVVGFRGASWAFHTAQEALELGPTNSSGVRLPASMSRARVSRRRGRWLVAVDGQRGYPPRVLVDGDGFELAPYRIQPLVGPRGSTLPRPSGPTGRRWRFGPDEMTVSAQDDVGWSERLAALGYRDLWWGRFGGDQGFVEPVGDGLRLSEVLALRQRGVEGSLGARVLVLAQIAARLEGLKRAHGAIRPELIQIERSGQAVLLAPGPEADVQESNGWGLAELGRSLGLADQAVIAKVLDDWAHGRRAARAGELLELAADLGLDPARGELQRWVGAVSSFRQGLTEAPRLLGVWAP